ncbi:MAG: tRNA 2-thiouridine(34) synthase MnmA, partial [bacterium]
MISKKKKILMCMSGGVDSSVAAVLLLQKGYDVTGAFMVNYDDKNPNKSCWRSD